MTQGPQSGALWQPRRVGWGGRWEGGSGGRGCMYPYSWFMFVYGRNQHNTEKQLINELKKKKPSNMFHFPSSLPPEDFPAVTESMHPAMVWGLSWWKCKLMFRSSCSFIFLIIYLVHKGWSMKHWNFFFLSVVLTKHLSFFNSSSAVSISPRLWVRKTQVHRSEIPQTPAPSDTPLFQGILPQAHPIFHCCHLHSLTFALKFCITLRNSGQ